MKSEQQQWNEWFRHISKAKKKTLNEELNYSRELFSFVPKLKGKKILDVGCGLGEVLIECCALGAKKAVGVDSVESVVKAARKNAKDSGFGKKISIVKADALKMPFRKNEFDIVFSLGLLEHFEDPQALLLEKKRVLKKGGFVVAVVPNSLSIPRHSFGIARRLLRPESIIPEKPITSFGLKKEFKKAGFRNFRVNGIYYFPYTAVSGRESVALSKALSAFNSLNSMPGLKHFAWFLVASAQK